MAPTIKSCKMLYSDNATKYKACLQKVKEYHETHTEKLSSLPKSLSVVRAATKLANSNPKFKHRLKRLAESAKTRHQLKRLTKELDKHLKKSKKGCSGRKKSTCGRTRSSAHCKWKKSKGCVKKPSGKTYVRSSSGSKKSARKVRCSGKRKARCNNMKSCRWNKKKSRCRASRARFNSFDESEQLFAPTVNLP